MEILATSHGPSMDPGGLGGESAPSASAPIPGNYYRIRRGDTLFGIAGKAYSVRPGRARLEFARRINRHPLNRKYLRKQASSKLFPEGLISFFPRYSCDVEVQTKSYTKPMGGRCYAVIWIPSRRDLAHPRLGVATDVPASFVKFALRQIASADGARKVLHRMPEAPKDLCGYGETVPVPDSARTPFRFVCAIFAIFFNVNTRAKQTSYVVNGPASGVLIGDRHVLTAAHVLDFQTDDGVLVWKNPILIVIPGFDFRGAKHDSVVGLLDLLGALLRARSPIGSFLAIRSKVPDAWKDKRANKTHDLFDYGLIKLLRPVGRMRFKGKPFGYWGSPKWGDLTRLRAVAFNRKLSWPRAYLSGYRTDPEKTEGFSQRVGCGLATRACLPNYATQVVAGKRERIGYQIHTADGFSGCPVWRAVRRTGTRRSIRELIAIHSDGGSGIGCANGVRFTDAVVADLKRWGVKLHE